MTLLAGLIGHPVGHSISPVFQQAAFDALGLDARYERWDTPPQALAERVRMLRTDAYLGANVTVPHKEQVAGLLDSVSTLAARAGAVNTVVTRNGALHGDNTDVPGFARALREVGGVSVTGLRVLLLGAGGAARAVVLALQSEGVRSITIANRHRDRAAQLANELAMPAGPALTTAGSDAESLSNVIRESELLVNCTTIGMAGSPMAGVSPLPASLLRAGMMVCDIVANPRVTPLLRDAERAGCRTLGGLPMLVFQGAAAFEAWTGRDAPTEIMMAAAAKAMDRIEAGG